MKHEVVDDELTSPGEEIRERLAAVGAIERVFLGHSFPRQAALQTAHLVALPRERLLFLEQRTTRLEPFVMRDDRVIDRQIVIRVHDVVPFTANAARSFAPCRILVLYADAHFAGPYRHRRRQTRHRRTTL